MFGLLRRNRNERAGFLLYGAAVAAARDAFYYGVLGVPDTLDGRFDLVGLHTCLVIRRLRLMPAHELEQGRALAQAVFDAMFSDMDVNLRELGVSDLSVGKRVRAMWEAFHGRARAYEAAFDAGDQPALAAALQRNVWRGEGPGVDITSRLARIAMAQGRHLAAQDSKALFEGHVAFLSPALTE